MLRSQRRPLQRIPELSPEVPSHLRCLSPDTTGSATPSPSAAISAISTAIPTITPCYSTLTAVLATALSSAPMPTASFIAAATTATATHPPSTT